MDEGLAIIPFPDVTEQIMVDAGLSQREAAGQSGVTGAVVFGNTAERSLGEHPWSVSVSGAGGFNGLAELERAAGGELRLTGSTVTLTDPAMVVNGVWWLSTGTSSPAENLPLTDDWVAGARSEPLYSGAAAGRRYPSPIRFDATFSFERRGRSARFVNARPRVEHAITDESAGPSVAWLGVRAVPEVLGELSSIEHLASFFDARPIVWLSHPRLPAIQALPMTQSANPASHPARSRGHFPFRGPSTADWSLRISVLDPTRSWGVIDRSGLTPAIEWASESDLPVVMLSVPGLVVVVDEDLGHPRSRFAFRHDVPMLDEIAAFASTDPALQGSDGGAEADWGALSRRAQLAALSGVTAFEVGVSDPWALAAEETVDVSIHDQPLSAEVAVDLSTYPGSVVASNGSPLLRADEGGTEGFTFVGGGHEVTAGSAALRRSDDGLKDQFGGTRGVTVIDELNSLVSTTVVAAGGAERALVSTSTAFDLEVPGGHWELWFRDLPCESGNDATYEFHNDRTGGLDGYEWRLGPSADLMLCGLTVSPLELVSFRAGPEGVDLVMAARLRLPMGSDEGAVQAPDTVICRFSSASSSGNSRLKSVELHDDNPEAIWPLSVGDSGVVGGGPLLRWSKVRYDEDRESLEVGTDGASGPDVSFYAFDRAWTCRVDQLIVFEASTTRLTLGHSFDRPSTAAPSVQPKTLDLTLDLDTGEHLAGLTMEFDAHDVVVGALVDLMSDRLESTVTGLSVFNVDAEPESVRSTAGATGFQAAWDGDAVAAFARPLLPGLELTEEGIGGYVAFTFETKPSGGVPVFHPAVVVAEMVMRATGEGSIGGDVTAGYIGRLVDGAWQRSLTASGFVTALNAFTFPFQDQDDRVFSPAPSSDPSGHVEHRVTVLLDQDPIPAAWLRGEDSGVFVVHATVEHELAQVGGPTVRSTVGQAVRFLPPEAFARSIAARSANARARERGFNGPSHPDVAPTLVEALSAFGPDALVMDAATVMWIGTDPLSKGSEGMVAIRRVLGGTLQATLAEPSDFTDPKTTWQSVAFPFIAVLGGSDQLPLSGSTRSLLDSEDAMTRATAALLAGRSDDGPTEIMLPGMDGADGRVVARLDVNAALEPSGEQRTRGRAASASLDSITAGASTETAIASLDTLTVKRPTWLAHAVSAPHALGPVDAVVSVRPESGRSPFSIGELLPPSNGRFTVLISIAPANRRRVLKIQGRAGSRSAKPVDLIAIGVSSTKLDVSILGGKAKGIPLEVGPEGFALGITYRAGTIRVFVDGVRKHLQKLTPAATLRWQRACSDALLVWSAASATAFRAVSTFSRVLNAREMTSGEDPDQVGRLEFWASLGAVTSRLLREGGGVHPAAAVVPASLHGERSELQISPYLTLGFDRIRDSSAAAVAVVDEVLAVGRSDTDQVGLRPLATKWWTGSPAPSIAEQWARAVVRREVRTSPIAVIRRRQVQDFGGQVGIAYRFDVVDASAEPTRLGWSGHQLRPEPSRLKYPQAQYGGSRIPTDEVARFDLVAPTITGVQPVRDEVLGWSGLRVVVRHSDEDSEHPAGDAERSPVTGVGAGTADTRWMALQHRARFREDARDFPSGFVAQPMPSDTVTADHPRLPNPQMASGDDPAQHWAQGTPITPEVLRYLLIGNRPGAVLELDALIMHPESADATVATPSGSVTVSHRVPRPLPLPENGHRVEVIQPVPQATFGIETESGARRVDVRRDTSWSSDPPGALRFEVDGGAGWDGLRDLEWSAEVRTGASSVVAGIEMGVETSAGSIPMLVGGDDVDAVLRSTTPGTMLEVEFTVTNPGNDPVTASLFVPVGSHGPSDRIDTPGGEVHVSVAKPANGTISTADTELDLLVIGSIDPETVDAVVSDGSDAVALIASDLPGGLRLRERSEGRLRSLIGRATLGTSLQLEIHVAATQSMPRRSIVLPLRVGAADVPLVTTPRFIRFRDPAYDRRLTTPAVQAATQIDEHWSITVSADRGQYGPESAVAFGYHWTENGVWPGPDGTGPHSVHLQLQRVPADGDPIPVSGFDPEAPVQSVLMAELSSEWQEGDRLDVAVISGATPLVTLPLAVVRQDPTPAPSSAYALLRTEPDGVVRCVRYAVGPTASKVEFVDLGDLRSGVVRRRATFVWTDIVRGNASVGHQIQKITAGGATYVPPGREFEMV